MRAHGAQAAVSMKVFMEENSGCLVKYLNSESHLGYGSPTSLCASCQIIAHSPSEFLSVQCISFLIFFVVLMNRPSLRKVQIS